MNSEELEQSLRTEFENYLKQVSVDMRQEITGFQQKVETEIERHNAQFAEIFQDFSDRAQKDLELDSNFKETVIEHLRLARDEGASITATAFAEAEEMAKQSVAEVVPAAGISELRDGINDISNQTSQAAILKSLVQHAGQFTPRGAFFIIKNEHFVGWRVFGKEAEGQPEAETAVREVFFPIAAETTLGESVKTLNAVEGSYGTHTEDSAFLDKLQFGEPKKMFAIPLVARGRGVAVLYADYGTQNEKANVEALETLVRVAGLTVEVTAASTGSAKHPSASARHQQSPPAEFAPKMEQIETQETYSQQSDFNATADYRSSEGTQFGESQNSTDVAQSNETPLAFDYQYPVESDNVSVQNDYAPQDYSTEDYTIEEVESASGASVQTEEFEPVYQPEVTSEPESYSWNQPAVETSEDFTQSYQPQTETQADSETYQPTIAENEFSAPAANEYQFETSQPFEPTQNTAEESSQSFDRSQFDDSSFESAQSYTPATPVEDTAGAFDVGKNGAAADNFSAETIAAPEPAIAAAKPAVRSRFSDKNVDLPIEVSEDERRLHNDARRFARLLVSEIKLYNEPKVKEGREGSDLYERLREAIDRSREMYDKRIQPPVAAKFDYFHYELVNTLADGDEAKLGANYPGATV